MPRIALRLYVNPGLIEVFLRLRTQDGNYELMTGNIDTGAELSLFPLDILGRVEHDVIATVTIEQAGIARQVFDAVEARVKFYLEDPQGNRSDDFTMRAWFAETDEIMIGFADLLERATLFIDMRQTQSGWIEMDESADS